MSLECGFFSVFWEWLQGLWPTVPGRPASGAGGGDDGYGSDPNG
jgi:hypothetical protein